MPIGARGGTGRVLYRAMGWLLGPRLAGVPEDSTLMLAELEAWLRADARPLLGRISSPALIVGGAKDTVFPPEIVEATASGMPDATVVIVPDVAHDVTARMLSNVVAPFLTTSASPT